MIYLSRLYLDVCVLVYILYIYVYINIFLHHPCLRITAGINSLFIGHQKNINFVLRCPTLIVVSSLLYVHPANVIMSLVNEHFAWGKPPASVLPNPADLCR